MLVELQDSAPAMRLIAAMPGAGPGGGGNGAAPAILFRARVAPIPLWQLALAERASGGVRWRLYVALRAVGHGATAIARACGVTQKTVDRTLSLYGNYAALCQRRRRARIARELARERILCIAAALADVRARNLARASGVAP